MPNVIVEQHFPVLEGGFELRHQMLDLLSEADLAYQFPNNLSLGGLCREMVEIEHSYIESFKTFKMDWHYKAPNAAELETKLDVLRSTYSAQEAALKAALSALSDETIHGQIVNRGGFKPLLLTQFHIYREANLIFYAKVSLYLRALQKTLPELWLDWIG